MKSLLALLFIWNLAYAREFNTERPDKARLAYTLQEKKLAFEPEFINYSTHGEEDKSALTIGEIFLRYGLTDHSELQIVTDSYLQESNQRGFGNTEIAFKQNILGNDTGDVALALIPYLFAPTAGADLWDDRFEGGLAFAMDSLIYQNYYFSVTLETNNIRRDRRLDWQSNFISIVSIGRETFKDLFFYTEIFNESGLNKHQGNITTFDLSIQYEVNPKLRFDIGTFLGISPDADDIETFAGASYLIN